MEEAAEVLLEAPEGLVTHIIHLLEVLAVYMVQVVVLGDATRFIVAAVWYHPVLALPALGESAQSASSGRDALGLSRQLEQQTNNGTIHTSQRRQSLRASHFW